MNKISAVYKIVNTVTNDYYVGSSMNVKKRWRDHKCLSTWKNHPSSKLYQDMQKYGVDKFQFQILAPVLPEYLKQVEQELIEILQPTYNNIRADGLDVERARGYKKEYRQTDKYKEWKKKYRQSDKGKEYNRKQARKDMNKYYNQFCSYNGETLKLGTLVGRFYRAGIEHPTLEAKKYLLIISTI